ncbi:hypothetical protein FOXG_20464 [Fusarium oxysporum f. sp. lycopersici 4287]|uniref:Uncharacterized protein n=2 Tax=Fusarium oxysporum TaxID=5507 RepID=A0A0J9VK28_FUSO4|nr:hypothetical protein FOXG_20464 [Fusarium oxysporum f. sp. lycopersici 4287]EXK46718.1 hypothetical protein FOMG_00386 [Fusarium oxysporum f. sp. melonis 26406]KNB11101.1 hypothetical protein FOXG_20464 [Fusarium oxysporum f. sp. lycopersici 4287]
MLNSPFNCRILCSLNGLKSRCSGLVSSCLVLTRVRCRGAVTDIAHTETI